VIAIDGGSALTGGTKLPMNFAEKIAANKKWLEEDKAKARL
jgi:hypothetical protein